MARQQRWQDFTSGQRAAMVVGGAVELVLTLAAGVDLARRPAERVRGPKALWAVLLPVQPVGPIAYLVCGRRRG